MKLKIVYFDAFKSLLKKKLLINEKCIGFVGINESGKSNILEAVNVLGGETLLTAMDTPKMAREHSPKIRFEFEPSAMERARIIEDLQIWVENKSLVNKPINKATFNIVYHVKYDKKEDKEKRYYTLSKLSLKKDSLVLRKGKGSRDYKIKFGENFISLNEALIIPQSAIQKNEEYLNNCDKLFHLNVEIEKLEEEIKSIAEQKNKESIEQAQPTEASNENKQGQETTVVEQQELPEISKRKARIAKLNEEKMGLENKVGEYNLHS